MTICNDELNEVKCKISKGKVEDSNFIRNGGRWKEREGGGGELRIGMNGLELRRLARGIRVRERRSRFSGNARK